MQIYFLFAVPLSLALLSLSIFGFNKVQKSNALLQAEVQDEQAWSKKYHGASFEEVSETLFLFILLTSSCQLLAGILLAFSGYHAYKFGELLEQNSVLYKTEILVMAQGLLSCLAICGLVNTRAGLTHLPDIAPVPPFLLSATIILTFILIIWSVLGFVFLYKEGKIGMTRIAFLSVVTASFLLVFAILLFLYIPYSKKELIKACSDMLPLLDDDYISKAGCTHGKYKETNIDTYSLNCPKEAIKFVWEINYQQTPQEPVYGCLNSGCCQIVIADIRQTFSSSVFLSILLSLVAIISSWSMIRAKGRIKETGREFFTLKDLLKGGHLLLLALVIAGIVFTIMYEQRNVYKAPTQPNFLKVKPVEGKPSKSGIFNFPESNYKEGKFKINVTIKENRTQCGAFCDDFIYYTTLSTQSPGRLTISPAAYSKRYVTVETSEAGDTLKFSCPFKNLNKIIRMVEFETPYPAKANKVLLEIKAVHEPDYREEWEKRWKGTRRRLSEFFPGEDPAYTVLLRNITFQIFPTPHRTLYRGAVNELDRNSGRQGVVSVRIKAMLMDEAKDEVWAGETDEHGNYEMVLPLYVTIKNFTAQVTPYQVLIVFSKEGYQSTYTSLTVGAVGFEAEETLPAVLLNRDYAKDTMLSIAGVAVNIVDEIPPFRLPIALTGPINKTTRSHYDGTFLFTSSLTCKRIQISVSDNSYYPFSGVVPCTSNVTIPLVPAIGEYRLRTVLYWSKGMDDLDLHVAFDKDNQTECKGDFTQLKCGGAVHRGDKKREGDQLAAETIDLETIGPHQYVFYVDTFEKELNNTMGSTEAKVEVYSGMASYPVAEIHVPTFEMLV
eukprot:TRINITY_DN120147_c0_g1_i1.p1 TRINITY_DN120147_c0_g1~~TRINITY_DN120147_c0_g1_i1.p1  ORF type:complete len:835 (-),score=60.60 TRINITY_DN120147_c0_g1_i1:303-2807(-)